MNDFYVYAYYKINSEEIFYIGKGCKNRYKEIHNRNSYFLSIYNKYPCSVKFLETGLSNEEACEREIYHITYYKNIGQAQCNFTMGGTGFSTGVLNPIHKRIKEGTVKLFDSNSKFFGEANGFYGKKHTEESKQKISESLKGKSGMKGKDNPMYGKKRFGEDNPMYGKKGFDHPNSRMYSIKYVDGSSEFLTWKQCEKKFGIAFNRIQNTGGLISYKKKCKNSVYENTLIEPVTTIPQADETLQ